MILDDGGKGDYAEVTPPMLGIWDTVMAVGSTPLLQTCIIAASCCCISLSGCALHRIRVTLTFIVLTFHISM